MRPTWVIVPNRDEWERRYWCFCHKCWLTWGNDVPDSECPRCHSPRFSAVDIDYAAGLSG